MAELVPEVVGPPTLGLVTGLVAVVNAVTALWVPGISLQPSRHIFHYMAVCPCALRNLFSHGVAPHCTCPTACPTTLALDTSPAWQRHSQSTPAAAPIPSHNPLPKASCTCQRGQAHALVAHDMTV